MFQKTVFSLKNSCRKSQEDSKKDTVCPELLQQAACLQGSAISASDLTFPMLIKGRNCLNSLFLPLILYLLYILKIFSSAYLYWVLIQGITCFLKAQTNAD